MTMEADKVQEALEDAGYHCEEYSGRGMYGQKCVGCIVDDYQTIAQLFVDVAQGDHSDLAQGMAHGVRFDNMGTRLIAYWPRAKI
jgi:hypothetical protein